MKMLLLLLFLSLCITDVSCQGPSSITPGFTFPPRLTFSPSKSTTTASTKAGKATITTVSDERTTASTSTKFSTTGRQSVTEIPTLVGRPLNTAVIQGSAVTFQCSSNDNSLVIQWYNSTCVTTTRNAGRCLDDLIYSGFSLTSNVPQRFSVTNVTNATHVTRDLNISPTQLTDAGVYLCAERHRGVAVVLESSSAQLIVLAGNTRCTTNVSASGALQENDIIMITCSITYRGNWAPVMRWFISDTRHNFTDDYITLTTSNTTVTSLLTVTASADLHGSQIVCITYFTQPSTPLLTTATNVPSYTYQWTSPTLVVQYAPRNLQITPRQSSYQPGDRIRCSAEGSPEPLYQWTDLLSGTVIQGAVLVITEDMVNKSHTFQCTASNQYNSISSTLQFTVEGTGTSSPCVTYKTATIALAVIAVIAIVIIVLLVLYIVNVKRRQKPGDRHSGDSATAAVITSHSPGDAYQQLNMTSRIEPVYKELERSS